MKRSARSSPAVEAQGLLDVSTTDAVVGYPAT
jgi:hypothetical protein